MRGEPKLSFRVGLPEDIVIPAPFSDRDLVLVTAASDEAFRFHNPSGHTSATQENAELAPADFDRFFANRGIAVAI